MRNTLSHISLPNNRSVMTAIQLYNHPSADYASKLAQTKAVLQQAAQAHPARIAQSSSLGAEDVVITHLITALHLPIAVFVLDTQALPEETIALLQRQQTAAQAAGRPAIEVWQPQAADVDDFVSNNGADAMYRSVTLRQQCCYLRKLKPLARALQGRDAWITGMRREQSGERADVPLVDTSEARHKYNPLALWTWGDVWHYIATHGVDYNPLHDQFYPSIGCAPCTRAISVGQDFRAGRWWWEQESAKECGLHVKRHPETKSTINPSSNT